MTPCEAQQRKARIRELELYGWTFVCSLTDEQFSAACNGCGPASWSEERRRRLSKWLAFFAPGFDVHDCRFDWDNDGTREAFDAANDELRKNCILLADDEFAWYNPRRYSARAKGRAIAALCQEFGWEDWKKAYNQHRQKYCLDGREDRTLAPEGAGKENNHE